MRLTDADLYASPDFETFWVRYQALHRRRRTRLWHLAATTSAATLATAGLATGNGWLLLAAPLVDYGIAQTSHRLFERNRTQPYRHLRWHARAELRLARQTLRSLARR